MKPATTGLRLRTHTCLNRQEEPEPLEVLALSDGYVSFKAGDTEMAFRMTDFLQISEAISEFWDKHGDKPIVVLKDDTKN